MGRLRISFQQMLVATLKESSSLAPLYKRKPLFGYVICKKLIRAKVQTGRTFVSLSNMQRQE
jgi:hypothetical protein